jgi:[acyl-carrier-protein] S-malonyltransferase
MGSILRERSSIARAVFERASACLGFDLVETCLRSSVEQLRATRVAQPAIFTTSAAALAALTDRGIEAHVVAGHSVGEFGALLAAGVFDFDTALRAVQRRSEIMAEAEDGAMISIVGLGRPMIERACDNARHLGPVCVGLHNAPDRFVVSGSRVATAAVGEQCRRDGARRVSQLQTQLAFHSPMMQPVMDQWSAFVASLPFSQPTMPIALNATGRLTTSVDDVRLAMVSQVIGTVQWHDCLQALRAFGATHFVEVGDSKVVSAMVRATVADCATSAMGDPRVLRELGVLDRRIGATTNALS